MAAKRKKQRKKSDTADGDSGTPAQPSEAAAWRSAVKRRLADFERRRAKAQAESEQDPRHKPTTHIADQEGEPDELAEWEPPAQSAHPDCGPGQDGAHRG